MSIAGATPRVTEREVQTLSLRLATGRADGGPRTKRLLAVHTRHIVVGGALVGPEPSLTPNILSSPSESLSPPSISATDSTPSISQIVTVSGIGCRSASQISTPPVRLLANLSKRNSCLSRSCCVKLTTSP